MAKITKKSPIQKKETFEKKPKKELEPLDKKELLEFHLGRIVGNSCSKQEVRAIFEALFRD